MTDDHQDRGSSLAQSRSSVRSRHTHFQYHKLYRRTVLSSSQTDDEQPLLQKRQAQEGEVQQEAEEPQQLEPEPQQATPTPPTPEEPATVIEEQIIEPVSEEEEEEEQTQTVEDDEAPGVVDASDTVDPHVTRVVQTISLVQVVDSDGEPVEIQTHYADPTTVIVDSESGATIEPPEAPEATPPSGAPVDDPVDDPVDEPVDEPVGLPEEATEEAPDDTPEDAPVEPPTDPPIDDAPEPPSAEPAPPDAPNTGADDEADVDEDAGAETGVDAEPDAGVPITTPNAETEADLEVETPVTQIEDDEIRTADAETPDVAETDNVPGSEVLPAPVPELSSIVDDLPLPTPPVEETSDLLVPSLDETLTASLSSEASAPIPTASVSLSRNDTDPDFIDETSVFVDASSSIMILVAGGSSSTSVLPTSGTSYSSISNPSSSSLVTTRTTVRGSSSTTWSGESATASSGSSTGGGAVGGGFGDMDSEPSATATSSSSTDDDGDDGDDGPASGTVVGGVLGGLAGVALLVALVLLFIRWKKRQGGRVALGDDVGRNIRPVLPGKGGPFDSGGEMKQARSQPTGSSTMAGGAAAALAGLGMKRSSKASSPREGAGADTGERGFYRVSGRKLPPVFTAGGDGYTDPREQSAGAGAGGGSPSQHQRGNDGSSSNNNDNNTTENPFLDPNRSSNMSGESVYYRDSQAFLNDSGLIGAARAGGGGGPERLALGTPMRPDSGVPVMRSGPKRMAVAEENPFADPTGPREFPGDKLPLPPRDAIGRSHGSKDGSGTSRGSGSRFMEQI